MGKDGSQLDALPVFQEGADFLGREGTSEPLHVVFHENLHRRALDRAGALDRHVCPTCNRHMGAEQNLIYHFKLDSATDETRIQKTRRACTPPCFLPKFTSIPTLRLIAFNSFNN